MVRQGGSNSATLLHSTVWWMPWTRPTPNASNTPSSKRRRGPKKSFMKLSAAPKGENADEASEVSMYQKISGAAVTVVLTNM